MARNPIIYGLASEIYVAESSDKGGTWSGVMDGLRKERTIFIREPNPKENNANNILISKGGIPVDIEGNLSSIDRELNNIPIETKPELNNIEENIIELLKTGVFSSKKIIDIMKIDWSSRKLSNLLQKREDILTLSEKPLKFTHKDNPIRVQKSLFD